MASASPPLPQPPRRRRKRQRKVVEIRRSPRILSRKQVEDEDVYGSPEHESKVRIGANYQAIIPECSPEPLTPPGNLDQMDTLMWMPMDSLSDAKVDEFIAIAKREHGYSIEQALGLLMWHKQDLQKTLEDLNNFVPIQETWSTQDKLLFEKAFYLHGKVFQKIQQVLPEKPISSLVEFYYTWKLTSNPTSMLDHQAQVLSGCKAKRGRKKGPKRQKAAKRPKPEEGNPDRQFWLFGPQYRHRLVHVQDIPPKDLYMNLQDVTAILENPNLVPSALQDLNAQLVALKQQTQSLKQTLGNLRQMLLGNMDAFRPTADPDVSPHEDPDEDPDEGKAD